MNNFEAFIGVNFWTALLTLCNFLLVLYVGKRFLYGPVLNIIHDRQKEIDDMYADAGAAKEKAQALQAEYQVKLNDAHATSERIVKEAVARGQSQEEEIIRKANEDAEAIMAKANRDISLEKKKAINEAKNKISEMALAIAGKVVGRELTTADQGTLIDTFIDELGDEV